MIVRHLSFGLALFGLTFLASACEGGTKPTVHAPTPQTATNPTSQTYVVTGASRGIGFEVCKQLALAGDHVFALARKPKEASELLQLQKEHPSLIILADVDVTSDDDVNRFVASLKPDQVIDVLINNAGVFGPVAKLPDLSLKEVENTLAINTMGPLRMTKALLPFLLRSSSPKVIGISSNLASLEQSDGNFYAYRMSKAALNMLQKTIAGDYPKIISIALHPGWTKTALGGPSAPTEVVDSARGVIKVIKESTSAQSGKFLTFEGKEMAW